MAKRLPPPERHLAFKSLRQHRYVHVCFTCSCPDLQTYGKEDRTGSLAAAWSGAAVTENTPLLGHQVILQRLNQQVFALRVVTHQQFRIHVAHQEVSCQQWQAHTLHELKTWMERVTSKMCVLKGLENTKGNKYRFAET